MLWREGTERSFAIPLNDEHRTGTLVCARCDQRLFTSDTKFDSGTGWPRLFSCIDNTVKTKTDRKVFMARTEYDCAHCGGHRGHVFEDGPVPTGLRYCNNGVALRFVPAWLAQTRRFRQCVNTCDLEANLRLTYSPHRGMSHLRRWQQRLRLDEQTPLLYTLSALPVQSHRGDQRQHSGAGVM